MGMFFGVPFAGGIPWEAPWKYGIMILLCVEDKESEGQEYG